MSKMNNKENLQHSNAECSLSVDKTLSNNTTQVDKRNGNTNSNNGKCEDLDNTVNVLTVKNNNTDTKFMPNSKADAKHDVINDHNERSLNDFNADVKNGNNESTTNIAYRSGNNTVLSTNLRKTHMAKSNPQINMTSSYVDIHPLSNSLMDTSRSVQQRKFSSIRDINMPTINNATSQVQSYSQSSNQLNDEALQRITQQFTPSRIPIVGYEVMEERARFTIYKLRIDDPRTGLSWMVFRRYTDFVRLYQKLKMQHRHLILPLPEKRVFRNNFDPIFLEERTRGLQLFVNAVVKKLSLDRNVREFFCLDEPPDVGDSEPEAQALFGALEDTVGGLKNQLKQQEDTIKYLRQKVFYLEEKMKSCTTCNPMGNICEASGARAGHSPMSSASSNGS